jgi:hypothetical protein
LEHAVEGAELDEAEHGPAQEWQLRVVHLRLTHETDDRGLLDKLRPYLAKRSDEKARIDEAERHLLEAARAERLQLLGTPVPRGAQPDGAVDPVPIPVTYLLKPVAVTLSYNRLTYDWDADVGATCGWKADYADLRVRTADVACLWPRGGTRTHLDGSAKAFDRTYWDYPMLLTWVYLRDREQVEQAADHAGSPTRLELLASMRRSNPDVGPPPRFATCRDAEVDITNKLQSGVLTGLGLENGKGNAKEMPELYWATARIHWDGNREPITRPEDETQLSATRWYGLRFRCDRILSLWPLTGSKKETASTHAEVDRPLATSWSETLRVDAITVAELPHMPMAEVARRWAQELGEHGTGEDTIRRTIWRAFWRGDLAREEGLLIPLRAKSPYPERQLEYFTRAKLLMAFLTVAPDPLSVPLERTPQTNEDGHVTDATDADYGAVADRWDEVVDRMEAQGWRGVYIDQAMIERGVFAAWCERTGRGTTIFWEHGQAAGSAEVASAVVVADGASDPKPSAPARAPAPSQRDWGDPTLSIFTRAELWLEETIRAGWSGTFETWHGEAIDAGIDLSQRQFRELWNAKATEEMKKPGRKTRNMPDLRTPG